MINYLKSWNLIRSIQLILALMVIMQGIDSKNWLIIAFGGLFSLMPLLGIGCCSSAGCATSPKKIDANALNTEVISYEEIK